MYTSYEDIYVGTYTPFEKRYGDLFTGYRMQPSLIGATTNPQTANQIAEVQARLNEGMNVVESTFLQPQVFESVPKGIGGFKEIGQLSKLTGADITLHSPLIEPSGFSQEGYWNESQREESERQFQNVLERSHDLNPKGGIVVVHASNFPATQWRKTAEGEKEVVFAYDREQQRLVPIPREIRYVPETTKPEILTPQEVTRMANETDWSSRITNLAFYKKEGDEIFSRAWSVIAPIYGHLKRQKYRDKEGNVVELIATDENGLPIYEYGKLSPEQAAAWQQLQKAGLFYQDIEKTFLSLYDKAYKNLHEWKKISDMTPEEKERYEYSKKILEEIREQWKKTNKLDVPQVARLLDFSIQNLQKILPPERYVPAEKFALDQGPKTIANSAFNAYKKYGEKAPIIAVENSYPSLAFSRAETLKKFIEKAREEFVERARKEGISEKQARKAAERMIGATWDIGHINMLRKAGYTEKEIIEETKKISPYVKHVHITDNFGSNDTHLPPGMGNVPVKKSLEILKKAGYKGKGIVEAGGFINYFKSSAYLPSLEAMGSPMYYMSLAPYWNQAAYTFGPYYPSQALMFPEQHYSMYGSGLTSLPAELGGQVPGKRDRFAGAPKA